MTYRELTARLENAGIDSASWDAALLLERFAGADRARLSAEPGRDYPVSAEFSNAIEKREARFPLQYLLGEWEFYRQTYEVSPVCLSPRADTEILVERAIKILPAHAVFADFCTGSGCIAVSVLCERPDTSATAVELFPETLALATRNAAKNGVGERFTPLLADVLSPVPALPDASFDAILSNPPYIPAEEIDGLSPEVKEEPRAALDGGKDGLDFYRAILRYGKRLLKPDGFFLFEIGYDQAEALRTLGREEGFSVFSLLRDYGGNDRVVELRR